MMFPHLNWNIRLLSSVFTCLLFPYFYLLLRSSRFLFLPYKPFTPLYLFIYISVFLLFFLCQSFLPPFLTSTFLWFFFLSVFLPLLTFNPRSSRGLNPNPCCPLSNWELRLAYQVLFYLIPKFVFSNEAIHEMQMHEILKIKTIEILTYSLSERKYFDFE